MALRARVEQALEAVGARLKRDKRHLIYALPNGQTVTLAKTSGDTRSDLNAVSDIKHAAGVVSGASKPTTEFRNRPKHPRKPGRQDAPWASLRNTSMYSALTSAGIVETHYKSQVGLLEEDLRQVRAQLAGTQRALQEVNNLWTTRAWRWLRRVGVIA